MGEQVVLPDALAEGKAVHVRQHHIQHRQIQACRPHTSQGVGGIIEFVDGEAFVFQIDLHQICDRSLVIDD